MRLNINNNLIIKFANKKDAKIILRFIKELAKYEKLEHEVTATEELIQENLFGENSKAEAILAYVDDNPVAFAIFFHNFSTFLAKPGLYLEDLYVLPEARGNGIGKIMLSFLAKLAIERDCGRLEWWVLDWNKPAIDFYENLGAESMDEWTVFRIAGDTLTNLANSEK